MKVRLRRFLALLKKETLQLLRDPVLIGITLYVFAESMLCAVALQLEVQHVPLAYVNADRSPESRQLLAEFGASPNFQLVGSLSGERAIVPALVNGRAKLVLRVPHDFSRSLARGRDVATQLILDGSDNYVSLLATSYAENIISQYNLERALALAGTTPHLTELVPEIRVVSRAWYNPSLNLSYYNIVIMVALSVPLVGILLAAAAFARERESGTLERLAVSPVRPWELLLAKTIPTAALTLIGITIGILLAVVGVHAPFRGDLVFFYAASLVAFVASGAIGVIIATAARTIQQALLGAFFVLFPLLFLSGTITPIENMPAVMQVATLASPLRYFGAIAVGVFFRGASPADLGGAAFGLLALTAALVVIALQRIAKVT